MGTTSISEVTEITNKTSDTYYMFVWDNSHEGRYTSFDKDSWNYPSDGKWLKIPPKAHLRADDCGIPDGGKSAGKDRCRVIFKAHGNEKKLQGDPGRGLRMNRVGGGDGKDYLEYADHATGETILTRTLPTSQHQNCLLLIDDKNGVQLKIKDKATSTEAQTKEIFSALGAAAADLLKLAVKVAEAVA
jgi:hypothetical protein